MASVHDNGGIRKVRAHILSDRACLQCQRRKTRCTGGGEGTTCSYCSKAGKVCIYGDAPPRTPLTRANLDAAEARSQRLESLLSQISPDVDVEAALGSSLGHENPNSSKLPTIIHNTRKTGVSGESTPLDYEWNEAFQATTRDDRMAARSVKDGMASLTAGTHSSGYLGHTSGSRLLESISSLLPASTQNIAGNELSDDPFNHFRDVDPLFSRGVANACVQDRLINAYFLGFNRSYPILHEQTFRDRCGKRAQVNPRSSWHIIYYMVLAIGEWISGLCNDEHSIYYELARSRLRFEILESGTIGVVQAFLLLGNYLQKRDRPNTGYNFIGIAYRVALGLGLHREAASSIVTTTFNQHQRRVLFWILYSFESGFSITTGRPNVISDAFIDVRKPGNIDDSQCDLSSSLPTEVDHPTTYSAIIAQARLAVIANKIYNSFLSARKYEADVDHYTAVMEQTLRNWRDSLPKFFKESDCPPWFRGPRRVVFWKEANLRTMLLLASQRHQIDEHEKIVIGSRCQTAAAETIYDIAGFCTEYPDVVHTGISWYAVYFLLQATLALGVHSLERSRQNFPTFEKNNAHVTWESAIQQAHECLALLGRTNKAALRSLQVLKTLHKPVSRTLSNTEPKAIDFATMSESTQPFSSGHVSSASFPATMQPRFTSTQLPMDTSPEALQAGDVQWMGSVDPSLHMFFDNGDTVMDVFQNVQGFPSVMENEYFGYVTTSIQDMRSTTVDSNH